MLYKNYSNKTIVLYDDNSNKFVIHPNDKIDDTTLPQIVFMKEAFIPFGMKRIPRKSGNRPSTTEG